MTASGAAVLGVVKMMRFQHPLNFFQPKFARKFCGHLIVGSFRHQTEFVACL